MRIKNNGEDFLFDIATLLYYRWKCVHIHNHTHINVKIISPIIPFDPSGEGVGEKKKCNTILRKENHN